MTIRTKMLIDYYVGGFLHMLFKAPTVLLGSLLDRHHDLHSCAHITVVKLLGGGSLAVCFPALLAIKRSPRVRCLTLVTTPTLVPFAAILGVFDRIIILRDDSIWTLIADSVIALRRLFLTEAIVDLEMHSRLTTVFSLLTCAYNRVGYCTRYSYWRTRLSTHLISAEDEPVYSRYDRLAQAFGTRAPSWEEARLVFQSRLSKPAYASPKHSAAVAIAPCCSNLARQRELREDDWIRIVGHRLKYWGPCTSIHLFGAASDSPRLTSFSRRLTQEFPSVKCVNHAGRLTLQAAVELITSMGELLCVDSALLHFARLAGVPTTSFWGPTDPSSLLRPDTSVHHESYYQKLPCSPCVHRIAEAPCHGNNVCMHEATTVFIQSVLSADRHHLRQVSTLSETNLK
jgi:ADP-heptose:LPS heptosyltransferase